MIGPRDERGDVGGDAGRGFEGPAHDAVAHGCRLGSGGVADHLPVRGRVDGEGERRLHVRLLEARIHASRVGGLELRVEVRLVVDGIDESVQALAGVHVDAVGLDHQGVVGLQAIEVHARPGEGGGGVNGGAVEGDGPHALGDEVDPGRRGCAVEHDRGCRREGCAAAGQVKRHVIGHDGDGGGSVARLGAGQVLGHCRILSPSVTSVRSMEGRHVVYELAGASLSPIPPGKGRPALIRGLDDTAHLKRWVDAGTLLGLVRDSDFIPHDTDIDIAVILTPDEGLALDLPAGDVVRQVRWQHLPMQFAYWHDGVIVDLYFYYSGIEKGYLVNCNTNCVLRIPDKYAQAELGSFEWSGLSIPTPSPVDDYLEWTYGSDWRTPKSDKGLWTEDRPNISEVSISEEWELPGIHSTIANYLDQARSSLPSWSSDVESRPDTATYLVEAVSRLKVAVAQRDQAMIERDRVLARVKDLSK